MPLFREGGPVKWLINKDLQFHFRDFEPGGRRFESVRARSNTLVKSNTWQSLRAEYAPKIEYLENSQVLDGSQLAGRMGEFAGDEQTCSQISRRNPASQPQCVRNAGLRVATLGQCGIGRCSFLLGPSRFGACIRVRLGYYGTVGFGKRIRRLPAYFVEKLDAGLRIFARY